jgi:AraC family transcriptional regulator of adaptative response/methylated-DNA-[protein]-cysteine methyltransferase
MLNDHVLWSAVCARDPQWDGTFVYGVPSTRIYCRPTCPSRRPGRKGVRFFAAPAAAEAAGFRACRRCRPGENRAVPPPVDRVRRACAAIAARHGEPLALSTLARHVGSSPHHLLRSFKRLLGVSPREFADACRVGCLKNGLRNGGRVTDAVYGAGYGSGSRVYERAGSVLGMTPARYAAGGPGEAVKYAIVDSPLGRLLVAATARGVCAVKVGDDEVALESDLRREYPNAVLARDDERIGKWANTIVGSLKPGAPDPRLPLDVRATAFQRLVWQELQKIPRGATRSYQDIAARIGRPAAARAVARACATNPVAIVVPCHRVVRGDGSLSGYAWGTERKRALLEGERS